MAGEYTTLAGEPLVMGRIAAAYGVKGWVRITTYTERPENLLDYTPWYLHKQREWQAAEVVTGRRHGKGLVAQLAGCDDRDAAAALTGTEVGIYRNQLPATGENEYYWNDLIGMQVMTTNGTVLGLVDHLIETGANDVLVVTGEREVLIPFIHGQVVESINPETREIRVVWDPDF